MQTHLFGVDFFFFFFFMKEVTPSAEAGINGESFFGVCFDALAHAYYVEVRLQVSIGDFDVAGVV